MIRIYSMLILLLCGTVACRETMTNENVIMLKTNIKNNAVKLTEKTLEPNLNANMSIYAEEFLVYCDSILIVKNKSHEGQYLVEMFSMETGELIRQFFRLGNGPDEMLSALIDLNGSVLLVNDFMKSQVAFVNLDSALQDPAYFPQVIRHGYFSPTVVEYTGNSLLMENPYCFKDQKLGIDNKAPRFVVVEKNVMYEEKHKYDYFTRNVACDGSIMANSTLDRVLYADFSKDVVEVYDYQLNLKKRIIGPDMIEPKYQIAGNQLGFGGSIPYAYLNYSADQEYVYLLYIGDMCDFKDGKTERDLPAWIFQFTWNGEFVKSYSLGRFVSSISLSKDGGFYCTAYDEEMSPILIKMVEK